MGTTKNGIFSSATNEMANLLKALGHPARFEIINLLRTEKTCCGVAIMNLIPLSQSTISKHLSELKNAEIIICENRGNSSNYTLNENALKKIESYFTNDIELSKIIISKNEKTGNLENIQKIEKLTEIKNQKEGFYLNKKAKISNPNLKKENYVFKHLLLKTSIV